MTIHQQHVKLLSSSHPSLSSLCLEHFLHINTSSLFYPTSNSSFLTASHFLVSPPSWRCYNFLLLSLQHIHLLFALPPLQSSPLMCCLLTYLLTFFICPLLPHCSHHHPTSPSSQSSSWLVFLQIHTSYDAKITFFFFYHLTHPSYSHTLTDRQTDRRDSRQAITGCGVGLRKKYQTLWHLLQKTWTFTGQFHLATHKVYDSTAASIQFYL